MDVTESGITTDVSWLFCCVCTKERGVSPGRRTGYGECIRSNKDYEASRAMPSWKFGSMWANRGGAVLSAMLVDNGSSVRRLKEVLDLP